jgi:hypothetical protein
MLDRLFLTFKNCDNLCIKNIVVRDNARTTDNKHYFYFKKIDNNEKTPNSTWNGLFSRILFLR